jgi:hypothetical protein
MAGALGEPKVSMPLSSQTHSFYVLFVLGLLLVFGLSLAISSLPDPGFSGDLRSAQELIGVKADVGKGGEV